ncbi:MAG: hypothetical protein JWR17_2222 [Pseudomonas sp.]|uniref:Ig-like domain-containing protein n=1 Tax=Pseudomonas sp. TaxID=306 RepID=UPI002614B99A|nr:Ig-like domain-containing protein [Pseudomonas sp.]MDB6049476.1 hypothetical protein [Pseudomonas sp.]
MTLFQKILLPQPKLHNTNDPSGIGHVDTLDPAVPVQIRIGPYIGMMASDYIELFWGDRDGSIANYTVKPGDTAEGTGSFVTLPVDQQYIAPSADANLHYQVDAWYTIKRLIGGTVNISERLTITVKLTVPGGVDKTPDTPYTNESLSLSTTTPEGTIGNEHLDQVTVNISAYENMEVNDAITVFWNGIPVRLLLGALPATGEPIRVPIPRETIISAGDSDALVVMYEVRDVVNNWSRWSLPTYLEVEAGNSTLPAPVAPQAVNLELDLALLGGADVKALVLPYPDIHPTDEITLTLERNTAEGMGLEPYVSTLNVDTSIGFVQFLIPNEQFAPIAQGRARLKYKVKKAAGDELRSKSLPLTIVGEAQVLAAPKLPAAEHNGGVLDPAAHHVIAQVPPYYFMADGNDVNLVWMGKTASGANVIHEELKNLNSDDVGETVAFLIPDEKVSALAGGTLELYYTVTTFARAFFKSPSLHVQVSAGGGALLPPATVDGVGADGVLDPTDIVLEAIVRIRPFSGMAPLDKVTLHWVGQSPGSTYSASTTLNSGTSGKEVIFRVKKSYVDANLNGNVEVSYLVERGNQRFASSVLLVKVGTPDLTLLPKPTVAGVDANDTLTPENIPDSGVQVTVPRYTGIDTNDSIIVKWVGNQSHITAAKHPGAEGEIGFAVPKSIAIGSAGGSVQVTYEVTRNNAAPVVSVATMFNVQALTPPLIIDTSEMVLNARHLRAAATPKHPPAGAFALRVASGGVAPYLYHSSAPDIAEVDATGRVMSVENGTATINVTDSSGQTASYEVKTSNVLTFVLLAFHTYSEGAKAVSNGGANMPSLADWDALRANYGGDPLLTYTGGAGREHRAWATDGAGFGRRWAIFPEDGRKVTLKDVGFGGETANAFGMKG